VRRHLETTPSSGKVAKQANTKKDFQVITQQVKYLQSVHTSQPKHHEQRNLVDTNFPLFGTMLNHPRTTSDLKRSNGNSKQKPFAIIKDDLYTLKNHTQKQAY
jgi:hypothetical protein